jgi:chaperonin GroES
MINKSGIMPVEFKCLILQDKQEEKTAGGVFIPQNAVEARQNAEVKATLVAVGGNAFEKWGGRLPVPGDRVYTAKYAGAVVDGEDGERYRLVLDSDITAIMVKEDGNA